MSAGSTAREARVTRVAIAALVLDFVLLATAFNIVVPVFENPDEHLHYFVAQHIAHTGTLPVQTGSYDTGGPWEQEGSQPPLYYILTAPLVRLARADLDAADLRYNHQNTMGHPAIAGNENRFIHTSAVEGWPWRDYALAVHWMRFVSTLMGAATVVGVWLIARRVIPGRDWLALAAACLVAFNPQFLAVSAAVTNDNAIILLATAALVLLLRVAEGQVDDRTVPLLAVVVGLAPLAKLSGVALVAFTLATLGGLAWRRRDGRFFVQTAGPVLIAVAVLAAWWFARNTRLYGDLTGIAYMLPGNMDRSFRLDRWLAGLPDELFGVWLSAWGIFGWFTILLPAELYALISLAALAALAGLAYAAWRRADWIAWPVLGWLAAWALVVIGGLLQWLTIAKGGHGRLLFPAVATLAVVLVAGWRSVAGTVTERVWPGRFDADGEPVVERVPRPAWKADRDLAGLVAVFGFAASVYSLLAVIVPAFAQPERIEAAGPPPGAVPADALFGDGLRLVGVALPDRVTAGERFPATLYWRVEAPIDRDGFVALRVDQTDVRWRHDARGYFEPYDEPFTEPGAAALSYPGRGNAPPDTLPADPDRLVVDRRDVTAPWPVTPDQPLAARFSVHLYDQTADERWPLAGDDGESGEWSVPLAVVPPEPLALEPVAGMPGPHARFENGILLYRYHACPGQPPCRGYTAYAPDAPTTLRPGDLWTTGVAWAVERDVVVDLSMFLHLVDASGRTVATFDGPPATHAPFPTSMWRAGDRLYAPVTWEIPDDAAPGARYTVVAGLYGSGDGVRVPVEGPDGARFAGDAVPLGTIEVVGR